MVQNTFQIQKPEYVLSSLGFSENTHASIQNRPRMAQKK